MATTIQKDKIKTLSVFGTRPEAIKMAPVVKALDRDPDFNSLVAVTAQHREMLDQVLDLFSIKPDYDLNIMKPNQTISMITSNVLIGLEEVIKEATPDVILVHGDTTTTFAASLAAFYQQCKVGHVEAGLRTYNKYSPFPEEMNRVLTSNLSDFHFAPTIMNRDNLLKEGINPDSIYITGNTVIDALLDVADKKYTFEGELEDILDDVLNDSGGKKRLITVTCHRRENLGENMENIFTAIRDIALEFDDVVIVYPVHMNPKVREKADKVLGQTQRVHLIEPLEYQPFVNLMKNSHLIITDSGGMQEEAPSLGKPVLVVRRETERPEAIDAGTVKLAGVKSEDIYKLTKELLVSDDTYNEMAHAVNPYGDGKAAMRIAEAIKAELRR